MEENMSEETFDKAAAVKLLNQIMEAELAGVVRYTHYSLMIFGHNRIPIVSWLRNEANTCLSHANEAGELVTHFGEHPSLKIGALLETHKHGVNDILIEALEAEKAGLALYRSLFDLVRDRSVLLEDYARRMIAEEELHVGEVNKMLRKPGEITQLLAEWREGNQSALDELYPLVYDELHRLARRYMSRERKGHTLQTTALI